MSSKYVLSILIPSRNEEFLSNTVDDILANSGDNTEILVGCDGDWPVNSIKDHPRVSLFHVSESIGQRAMTNQLCRLSKAKYVMKADAHCSFDKGFDQKMIDAFKEVGDDVTMIPTMRNLHAFDWVCENGHRQYQDNPGPCKTCKKEMKKEIVWIAKKSPQSNAYRFDHTMHFQYWNDWAKKQKGDLTETMSIQGSCFMLTRDKYWELDISSEEFNSWGQQGVEVACKTWLSGGRVIVNRRTWYSHMFRTKHKEFGFPYENPESKVQENRELSKKLFRDNQWKGAKRPFSWLLDHFNPPDWNIKKPTVGILYYSDNQLNMKLAREVRKNIAASGLPITSVTLKPTKFGRNIHLPLQRGKLTMHKQILAGLNAMTEDIVYFCEHDVLYHPSHFKFIPPEKDVYYYNKNLWRVRAKDGFAVKYDHKSLSQICAWRETLIKEYNERVRKIELEGWDKNGYEPGTRSIKNGGFSDSTSEYFESKYPNIDIRHDHNLSASKWKPEEFNSHKSCRNWQESNIKDIPGWEITEV